MNQLKTLLCRLKPNEINELRAFLKKSRGRSKKKFQLFRVIINKPDVTELSAMKLVYGNSENAKENFRKLQKRLESDLLNCLEKRNKKQKKEGFSNKVLMQLKKIDVMMNNSYSEGAVLSEIEDFNKRASNNQMFLNKVVLERVKCESFYLTSCPLESLNKVKTYHELSKYVSLAHFFYLSCKRHYFYYTEDPSQIKLLKDLRNEINEYYMITSEPKIGFYYHLGSLIMNFISDKYETCDYHNIQIKNLQNNHAFLSNNEYSDEYTLLKTLCSIKKINVLEDVSNYLELNFFNQINGSEIAFYDRIKRKPFEIDLTLQFLLYQGAYDQVLEIVKEINSKSIFSSCDELTNKFDLYSLNSLCSLGDYHSAKILFNTVKNRRNNTKQFRFYRPLYEYILHKELNADSFDINYESYQRSMRRNMNQLNSTTTENNQELKNILNFIYTFIRDSLKLNWEPTFGDNYFTDKLKALNISTTNDEIHISLFLKWAKGHFKSIPLNSLTSQY